MSLKLRKLSIDPALGAFADQLNNLRDLSVGTNIHASATAGGAPVGDPPVVPPLTTTLPVASDPPTSWALANDLLRLVNTHFPDAFAHKTAVSAALATPPATSLATANTLANAIKAAFTTHLTAVNVHWTNDAVNTIAAPNATDQGTLNTLLNEMRTDIPAHIAAALAGQHIELIPA